MSGGSKIELNNVVIVTGFFTKLPFHIQVNNLITIINFAKKLKAALLVPFFNLEDMSTPTQMEEYINFKETDFGNVELFFDQSKIDSKYTYIMLDIDGYNNISEIPSVTRVLYNNLEPKLPKIKIVWRPEHLEF